MLIEWSGRFTCGCVTKSSNDGQHLRRKKVGGHNGEKFGNGNQRPVGIFGFFLGMVVEIREFGHGKLRVLRELELVRESEPVSVRGYTVK